MKGNKDIRAVLQAQWECALERAAQARQPEYKSDSDDETLNQAAGIKVQSRVQVGRGTYGNCTYPIAICP